MAGICRKVTRDPSNTLRETFTFHLKMKLYPQTFDNRDVGNLRSRVDEAVPGERLVEIVGEEYFDNASPALVRLFCSLLNLCPRDVNTEDLLEVYAPYLDDTNDPKLESLRVLSVDRLFRRITTYVLDERRAADMIDAELRRLADLVP